MQTVLCPECHAPIPASKTFCTRCGAPLAAPNGTLAATSPPQQASPRGVRGRCLGTMGRCLIAVAVAVLAAWICIAVAAVVGIALITPSEEEQTSRSTANAGTATSRAVEAETRMAQPPIETWTRPVDGAEMVYVPAGEFLMGSTEADPDARPKEQPQHTVYLDAFWIDRTEVTQAQYGRCLKAGACPPLKACGANHLLGGDLPAVCVSWYDAQAYASWVGGRLPTEAEWEKAARGTDGRIYPWGDSAIDPYKAKYSAGLLPSMVPVGSYPVWGSPYGALDMAGNAAEWAEDWYDEGYYQRSSSRNPQGPESGEYRVLRGGGWSYPKSSLRAAHRQAQLADSRSSSIGFRVVVAPGPPGP